MKTTTAILALALCAGKALAAPADIPWQGRTDIPRETIEWQDTWVEDGALRKKLPRVLLLGDSISRQYRKRVSELLAGKAVVCNSAGSHCVGDPMLAAANAVLLDGYRFDVIHVNNGLHGWNCTDDDYAKYLAEYIDFLRARAPQAKFIWARTTPISVSGDTAKIRPDNARVERRNADADKIMAARGIPLDDLYATVADKPAEYHSNDGTHFNAKGVEVLAQAVVKSVLAALAPRVPEPKPVKGPIEVHAFYYPGTEQMAEWDMVDQTLPGIKPLLGWYDEGNPEVVDWQIKWAAEHGISAFCVDWYWNRGDQRLNHWVDAYYRASHRRHLKWYMMYANHNEPGAHSTDDQIRVTKYWIDNFFKTPEYYTIDGKPVVVYWSFDSLDADFRAEMERKGQTPKYGDGAKYALALTDRMAREAGLPGVYFIDMYHGWSYMQDRIDRARNAGYMAQMIYNFDSISSRIAPEAVHPGDTDKVFSYDAVVAAIPKWWDMTSRDPSFPFWPMIPTGWNDIPRSFKQSRVIYGRSVEKFRKICADCRAFCEKKGFKRVIIAPLNEWQEGSYIEPNEEFGFGMYDAIRDVFCDKPAEGWPKNVVPKDVGCGPYDYPAMPHLARTAWDFKDGTVQGWYRNPYGTAYLRNRDGALWFFRSFQRSLPAIRTRLAPFPADKYCGFRVRMRLVPGKSKRFQPTGKEKLTLWWGTDKKPVFSTEGAEPSPGGVILPHVTYANSASTPVKVDGEWHEYTLDLLGHKNWTGMVDEVWFDPVELQYADVLIDSMAFVLKP